MRPAARALTSMLIVLATSACQSSKSWGPTAPTEGPGAPQPQVSSTLRLFVDCRSQPVGVFCRIQVSDGGDEVTSKVVRSHWSWGDGLEDDQYLVGLHTFPEQGLFNYTVVVFLNDGRTVKASGIVRD